MRSRTLKTLLRGGALGAFAVAGAAMIPTSVKAAPTDISVIDIVGAAPASYDHLIGGGAYGFSTTGLSPTGLTTLDAHSFKCGDYVTYLVQFRVRTSPIDVNETVQFDLHLGAASPLVGPGKGFTTIGTVAVNYGAVSGGTGAGSTDGGEIDDGGSSAVLLSQFFAFADGTPAPGPFVPGSELVARIKVNDLEATERVIVRIDAAIGCSPTLPGGGILPGYINNVIGVSPAFGPVVIRNGNMSVPMNAIGDIGGSVSPVVTVKKTVTTVGGSCPGTEQIAAQVGDTVKYCYEVANTGTAHLHDVTLVDDNGTPDLASDDFAVTLLGLTNVDRGTANDDLAAGATARGQALAVVDFRGGPTLVNRATAAGTTNDGQHLSSSDTAAVLVTDPPASIDLVIKASLDGICGNSDDADPLVVQEGTPVRFCYFVTNTGTTTVSEITIPGAVGPAGTTITLPAGGSGSLISPITVASLNFSEMALATGTSGTRTITSNVDAADVIVPVSDLSILVTASLDDVCGNADDADLVTVLAGTPVYYCYQVNNVGQTAISGVTVSDPLAGITGSATIPAGGSYTFISGVSAAADDSTHVGVATGTDSYGFAVASDPDPAGVDVVHPSLAIVKTVSLDATCPGSELVQALVGQTVTYCYTVVNTGDTQIDGVVVRDDGALITIGSVAPGASGTGSNVVAVLADTTTSAVASGTDAATTTPVLSGGDDASVDIVHPALTTSVTVSLDGTCPGQEIVNVLAGTSVTWCSTVTNTGDTAIGSVSVTDDSPLADPAGSTLLGVGESVSFQLSDVAALDLLLNGWANGISTATGTAVQSNHDRADVNVVAPGINVDVTVSLTGTCPGQDSVTVPAGTFVTYCYDVANLGDDALTDVVVTSASGAVIGTIPSLAAGSSGSFQSAPVAVTADGSVAASVSATDIYGFPVADTDTALVDALFANLHIQKDAPATLISNGSAALPYTITVSNLGEAAAVAPTVIDTLPAGVSFVSATSTSGTCSFAAGTVTCALADLAPGARATVTINTTTTQLLSTITNTAFATSQTPDSDASDNSDDATTQLGTGATRTIGFYSNHPTFTAACLAVNGGTINLGFTTLRDETADNQIDVDKDTRVETGISLAMGILNANVAKYTNKQARSPLEQARMQAGRQVLAAICNSTLLNGRVSFDLQAAVATLAGTDIQAILAVSDAADRFNNSGDAITIGVNPGPANSKFAWDDPTDSND